MHKLKIIHLDDQRIFSSGVKKLIETNFPTADVSYYLRSQDVLDQIENCLQNKIEVNLIITDYNHLGDNGVLISRKVRTLESIYS